MPKFGRYIPTRLPGGWTAPIVPDVRIISAGTSTVNLAETEWGTIIASHSSSVVVTLPPVSAGLQLTFVILSGAVLSAALEGVVQLKANTAAGNFLIGSGFSGTTVSITCQSSALSTGSESASVNVKGISGTQALVQTFGTWI